LFTGLSASDGGGRSKIFLTAPAKKCAQPAQKTGIAFDTRMKNRQARPVEGVMASFKSRIRFVSALCIALGAMLLTPPLFAPPFSGEKVELEEFGSATSSVQNPAIGQGSTASQTALDSLKPGPKTQGLQFRDPVVSPNFTYRNYHDSNFPGSFGGHEYSGDIALDADIYDGLVAGAMYQYLTRNGNNVTGTNEDMSSNGFSIFLAKRLIDLVNVGGAYNFASIDHDLTGTTVADLDRISNGFTAFAGVSDKFDAWYLSSTASFTYAHDGYDSQPDLDTGLISWSNEASYDVVEWFTAGIGFGYHYFAIQDTFPGVPKIDDDYWTVGPRFRFYPTDQLSVNLDLETQQDFKNYDSYMVRGGVSYAF
jgi:hypothetical protein